MRTRFLITLSLALLLALSVGVFSIFAQGFPGNAPMCYELEVSQSVVRVSFESNEPGYDSYGLLYLNGELIDWGLALDGEGQTEIQYVVDSANGVEQEIFLLAWYILPDGGPNAACGLIVNIDLSTGEVSSAEGFITGTPTHCFIINPGNWTEEQLSITGPFVQISVEEKLSSEGVPGTIIQVIFEEPSNEIEVEHTVLVDNVEIGGIRLRTEDSDNNGNQDFNDVGPFERCILWGELGETQQE